MRFVVMWGLASLLACKFEELPEIPADAPTDGAVADGPSTDAYLVDAPPTTVGPFAGVSALVAGRMDAAGVLVGDRLYMVGGTACATCNAVTRDASGTTAAVEVATVSAAGPGTFALTSSLGRPRAGHVAFRVTRGGTDWLYVVGGFNNSGGGGAAQFPLEVERAPVSGDGTIGAFADVAGVTLDGARALTRVIVTTDTVFLVGGWAGGSTYLASVTAAPITASGDLTSFAPLAGVTLSAPRARMTVVQGAGFAVVAGGQDAAGAPVTTTERTTLSSSSLTSFSAAPVLGSQRGGGGGFLLNGRVWIAGGGNPGASTALDTIETAQVSPAGPFVVNSRRLAQARALAVTLTLPAHVCVLGGSVNATPAGIVDAVSCAPVQ